MESRIVVLRNMVDELGSRHLQAMVTAEGDLVISGTDHGDGVEQIFGDGYREYEWVWTISADQLTSLSEAADGNLLDVLEQRFSGEAAAGLGEYLAAIGAELVTWSRIGD
jgi:hypothetical protein